MLVTSFVPVLVMLLLSKIILISCDSLEMIEYVEVKEKKDPDFGALTPKLVKSRGYGYELHHVLSPDGFINAVHRIINPKFLRTRASILCFHGTFMASTYFLNNSPGGFADEPFFLTGANIGFELAKRGFDVWLLDQRATPYSKNHTTFDEDDKKNFWNWSLDQIALLDLPTAIDYILAMTGQKNIAYLGHSQGSRVMLMLMSRRKEYNDLIKPFIALSPHFFDGDGLFSRFPATMFLTNGLTEGILGFMGGKLTNSFIRKIFKIMCAGVIKQHLICPPILYFTMTMTSLMTRFAFESFNFKRLPVYASSQYYTVSSRQAAHFLQIARTNRPSNLDLTSPVNVKVYGSEFPPIYDPRLITCPHIALFSSLADLIVDQRDVQQLRETMTAKPIYDTVISDPSFGHFSFLLGQPEKVIGFINRPILEIMDKIHPW